MKDKFLQLFLDIVCESFKLYKDNFDKLLVTFVLFIILAVVLHIMHHTTDQSNIAWARELVDTVLGCLLGLITGHAIATRTAMANGNVTITDNGK